MKTELRNLKVSCTFTMKVIEVDGEGIVGKEVTRTKGGVESVSKDTSM